MKKLKIAIVSTPYELVPPKKYGGIELVVYNLTEELVKRGHELYLLAPEGSKTSAKLFPVAKDIIPQSSRAEDHNKLELMKSEWVSNAAKILLELKIDIIHNHWSSRLIPAFSTIGTPIISTIPYNLHDTDIRSAYENFKEHNYIAISENQKKGAPNLNFIGRVYHGINVNNFEFSENKGKYFAFLGRIWPIKGPKEAILAARKAKVKLKIAARIDIGKAEEYFKKEISPLIDDNQIQFIGEVSQERKKVFLKNAIALVSPIQWEEPFGLIYSESMACGTPIIAFARGSVPEIVKDGETGFVVNFSDEDIRGDWIIKKTGIEGIVEAVNKIKSMPENEYIEMRNNCRNHVEKSFTAEKMADEYEKIYHKVLKMQKD